MRNHRPKFYYEDNGITEIKQREILLFNTSLRVLISIGHLKWKDFFRAWRIAMSICQGDHDKLTEISQLPPVFYVFVNLTTFLG